MRGARDAVIVAPVAWGNSCGFPGIKTAQRAMFTDRYALAQLGAVASTRGRSRAWQVRVAGEVAWQLAFHCQPGFVAAPSWPRGKEEPCPSACRGEVWSKHLALSFEHLVSVDHSLHATAIIYRSQCACLVLEEQPALRGNSLKRAE